MQTVWESGIGNVCKQLAGCNSDIVWITSCVVGGMKTLRQDSVVCAGNNWASGRIGMGCRNILTAGGRIVYKSRRIFFSRAHGNFEEQNKVLESSITVINLCIVINAYYNYCIIFIIKASFHNTFIHFVRPTSLYCEGHVCVCVCVCVCVWDDCYCFLFENESIKSFVQSHVSAQLPPGRYPRINIQSTCVYVYRMFHDFRA